VGDPSWLCRLKTKVIHRRKKQANDRHADEEKWLAFDGGLSLSIARHAHPDITDELDDLHAQVLVGSPYNACHREWSKSLGTKLTAEA
jgi:hypothetical protein